MYKRQVLKWAREKGCPWNSLTCSRAAKGGHLEVLKWARENGCPWNEQTCAYAAKGGHLEVLKWAHANGCPTPTPHDFRAFMWRASIWGVGD